MEGLFAAGPGPKEGTEPWKREQHGDGLWVHVDSTLDYPISLDHPYYYEQNWGKEYQYVLAFTADKVEDVTQRYTQKWEAIQLRRLKNKNNNAIDFPKIYSGIR